MSELTNKFTKDPRVKVSLIPNDFSMDLEKVFKLCKEENVHYVELAFMWGKSILDLNEEEIKRVKDLMDKYDLEAASIQTQIGKVWPPISPNAKKNGKMHDDYEYNISRIDRAIELAEIFDTPYIISYGFRGRNEGDEKTREKYWEILLETYQGFIDKLKGTGKTMCIECDGGQLIGTVDDYLRILTHFSSPHLRANFDLANLYNLQEFTREDYERLHKWVPYFHVKDKKINKSWRKFLFGRFNAAVFGEGDIPWPRVLKWFAEGGFNGILSVEPHVHGADRFEKGRRCVQNLHKLLDELGIEYI